MEEQKSNPTFMWRSLEDKPSLPTDYSPSALEAAWGFHHTTIANYITTDPIFDLFYQWMRYATIDVVGSSPYTHRGIPAELEPFFHAYLDFLLPSNEPRRINSKTSIAELEHLFSLSLYQKAVAAEKSYEKDHIRSGEAQPTYANESDAVHSGLYWYRRLYENPHFQDSVSRDYWRKEYAWRCQLIEELSLKLPQVQQIQELKTMISYMDIQIAYLLCCVDQPINSKESKPKNIALDESGFEFEDTFLSTFPPQLINAIRSPDRTVEPCLSSTKRTGYEIPNIPIEIDNPKIKHMENAFNLISKPRTDPKTRQDIRTKYLNLVCDIPEKSDFQKVSEDLQNYLSLYTTTSHDLEKYRRYIHHRCLLFYRDIMWYNIPIPDDCIGYPIISTALQQFVNSAISSFYNSFCEGISDILATLRTAYFSEPTVYCSKHCNAINDLVSQGLNTRESLYNSWAFKFKSDLQRLWPTSLLGPVSLLDTEFSQDVLDKICSLMAENCHAANCAYGVMIDWTSEDLFRAAWKRYFQTQALDETTPPAYGNPLDILLSTGLLIVSTWISINSTLQITMNMFTKLTAYINEKNDRPPKAACQDSAVTSESSKQSDADRSGRETVRP